MSIDIHTASPWREVPRFAIIVLVIMLLATCKRPRYATVIPPLLAGVSSSAVSSGYGEAAPAGTAPANNPLRRGSDAPLAEDASRRGRVR